VAGGAVVLLVGAFAVHAAAGPSGPSGLRTAAVTVDGVDQTLPAVGVVEPVDQAAVAFPVAGTVATVAVTVGQSVASGTPLATLDGAALQQAIDAQQAAVDQAELALAGARDGGSTSAPSGSTRTASSSAAGPSSGQGGAGPDDAGLAHRQQALITAQQGVDRELLRSEQQLATASAVCAVAGPEDGSTGTDPTAFDPSAIQACQRALQDVLDAQQAVHDAEADVRDAAADYDQALQDAQRALDAQAASSPASPASAGGGRTAASSADLIKDQAAVDAARAQLAVAQQALAQATIVSPIDGTVTAVGLAPGDRVTAASTTQTIVVVGPGGHEVSVTVGVDRIPDVRVGQSATVTPDGGHGERHGTVVAIGAPSTTSAGATTYPVTVSLPNGGAGLRDGSIASVAIVTKSATGALVVPTSAVHTNGTLHTVRVVDGGRVATVSVRVGAVGTTWTQVTNGLKAGQRVVLADLSEPLPTSATQSQGGGRTGPFPFPGGTGGFRSTFGGGGRAGG
jgi:HlyD family secretion protein